jgi:hypothetical protein
MTRDDGPVYVYALRSEVHVAQIRNGQLLVPEACNTDDMAGPHTVRRRWADVPHEKVPCRRCFPDGVPEE